MKKEHLEIVIELTAQGGQFRALREFSTLQDTPCKRNVSLAGDSVVMVGDEAHALAEPADLLSRWTADETPDGFDRFFDERGQFDLGTYLYGQLFVRLSKNEQRALQTAEHVDLVIVTGDVHLASLPWPLLACNGRFVAATDWTIALCHRRQDLERQYELPHSAAVLVAAPNPCTERYGETGAKNHVEELEWTLSGRNPELVRGERLTVVQTWDELIGALRQSQPDVLYYYGHGTGDHRNAALIFQDQQGRPEPVPVIELAHRLEKLPRRPMLAYVNCCHGQAGGALGVGVQLAPTIPAVVTNRTLAFVRQSQMQASRFLQETVLDGIPPHVAARSLYALSDDPQRTFRNPRWMTPVVYRGYGPWKSNPVGEQGLVPDPNWREKLDREYQFGAVFTRTSQMLRNRRPRGMAFIWYGREGDGLEAFHQRLYVEFRDLFEEHRVLQYRPSWPPDLAPCQDSFDLAPSFVEMVQQAFEVRDLRDVSRAVRLEAGPDAHKTLVYIRHQPITHPEVFNQRYLKDYLVWWDLVLPQMLTGSQFCLLGISCQLQQDFREFEKLVQDDLKLETLAYTNSTCTVLLPFAEVDEAHLNRFINEIGFPLPAEGRAERLEQIRTRSRGRYDQIIGELEVWLRRVFRGRP